MLQGKLKVFQEAADFESYMSVCIYIYIGVGSEKRRWGGGNGMRNSDSVSQSIVTSHPPVSRSAPYVHPSVGVGSSLCSWFGRFSEEALVFVPTGLASTTSLRSQV